MSLNPQQRLEIIEAIKKRVLKHHINVAGVNYAEWIQRVDARKSDLLDVDIERFEAGVRALLAELGSSHTVFYHERTNRVLPQHSINATLRAFQQDGVDSWFFLDVFEDGPAHVAGIRPGEFLVAVDGKAYTPPAMPPFQLGQTFTITVSDSQGRNRRDLTVAVPYRKGTKERPPIVEPKALTHRMVQPGIGLLTIPYFPGPIGLAFGRKVDAAVSTLNEQGCDRLIVDLRGNIGGSLGFARLASYFCPGKLPIGHSLTPGRLRNGYTPDQLPRVPMPQTRAGLLVTLARFAFRDKSVHLLTQGLGPQPFHCRIVLLVNEWTNSASEMVANFAAENRLATIVGTRTAGNVLGAVNFKVGGGYWVRLPIFGWYTSQGQCLEGKGVRPDLMVEIDPALLSAGIDSQMNMAIEILARVAVDNAARP